MPRNHWPEPKDASLKMIRLNKALDGCHRWGWLISPIITGLMFAYFMGGLNDRVQSLGQRVSAVESTVTQILMRK